MKIGAGGLQAQVAQDGMPGTKAETGRLKTAKETLDADISHYQNPVNRSDLFKAVEKLNKAAELFNQPYEFRVNEDGKKPTVELTTGDKTQVVKEIPSNRVIALAQHMEQTVGLLLDEHV